MENPDFEPLPIRDLTDPTMAFWVHHTLPILKQGRTVFWNPKTKSPEEEVRLYLNCDFVKLGEYF